MVKLKTPLFSFGAIGRLGKALTVTRRPSGPVLAARGRPAQPRTEPQLTWRTMFLMAAGLWHDLSEAERLAWEHAGTQRHMTGYSWFMSQALRPNPGIYLPLAGGVMTGAIDMDGSPVTGVLDPLLDQDAATKKYHDDNLPPGGYTQGARARRSTDQNINSGALTAVIYDTVDYDTDTMWEGVTNPERVTITTAGIYLVTGQLHWSAHAAGYRGILLWHSTDGYIAQTRMAISAGDNLSRGQLHTAWECAAGTYLELRISQNSGVQIQANADGYQASVLSAQRIG